MENIIENLGWSCRCGAPNSTQEGSQHSVSCPQYRIPTFVELANPCDGIPDVDPIHNNGFKHTTKI